jgi:peptidoglycan hydrolase-like protein with peptidoglycan-binding domain/Flp pilus assembly protein TadD
MQAIRDGLRGRKKQRQSVWWALVVAVLALVSPATAMGAQGQTRPQVTTSGAIEATTGADRGSAPHSRHGHNLLALGSGYGIRNGSPLVRELQRRLALADYPAGGVDGLFGPRTWRAVVAFQASQGLRVDGIVGPRTWAALSAPLLSLGPGAGDQLGGSSEVRSLQRGLARVGDRPGPIDGRYGALTEQAVRRFQSARRLPVSGMAGARMLALLGASVSHRLAVPRRALPHKPAPASKPHGSTVGSPAPRSNVFPTPPQRPATATPTTVPHGSSHRSGPGATPWVTIVGGLALAVALILAAPLMVGVVQRARSRRDSETGVASGIKTPANAQIGERGHVATAGEQVRVAPRQNGSPVPANGHHAEVAGNGHRAEVAGNGRHAEVVPTAEDPAGAFNIGLWLEAQGSVAEAQTAYGHADERGHGAAASNLGRLLEEQGALAEAEAAYRRADERGDGAGAFNLGLLFEDRGAVDEAGAAYRRATDRGHPEAATNLGVLLEEQGALDEAEAAYRLAVEHGSATASFNLGVLLEERGDLAAAEEAYRRAEELGDDDVANMARAAVFDLRGETQAAGAGRVRGADNA